MNRSALKWTKVRFNISKTDVAISAAGLTWSSQFSLIFTKTPRSFSHLVSCKTNRSPDEFSILYAGAMVLWPLMFITLYFPSLNSIFHFLEQLTNLSMSSCIIFWCREFFTTPISFVSSANSLQKWVTS